MSAYNVLDDFVDHLTYYDWGREEHLFRGRGTFFAFSEAQTIHGDGLLEPFELYFRSDGSAGGLVFRSVWRYNELAAGFESLSNLIECCAEGLEAGIPPDLTTGPDGDFFKQDWEYRIAFWEICARKNPYFGQWQRDIDEFWKPMLEVAEC